jgi:hypothetical protein
MQSADQTAQPRAETKPSRTTIVGLALFGLLAALLTLPGFQGHPVGGAVLWVIGYGTVAWLLRQVWLGSATMREWWRSVGRSKRWSAMLMIVVATLVIGLVVRETAPELFRRFSRENGLWEPLCLLMYWGGALLLYRHVRGFEPSDRRPWLLLVGLYALLGFEEIDYFGIFGGLIGRIDGVYTGSLHDLFRLASERVLSPTGMVIVTAILLVVAVALWRTGYLNLVFVRRLLTQPEAAWLVLGFAILGVAASQEAQFFGWVLERPRPEEVIELAGALCLGVYALELAAERLPALG